MAIIQSGDKIGVWYVGTLKDGTLFDTNLQDKAKEHNVYNSQRNYEPLEFFVDKGQMIRGFDKGVLGMKLNEKKTIEIKAGDAYGEWTEERIVKIDKNQLPTDYKLEENTKVMIGNGQVVRVHKIEEEHVHFDMNHELAGKDLVFEVEIVSHSQGDIDENDSCGSHSCGCC